MEASGGFRTLNWPHGPEAGTARGRQAAMYSLLLGNKLRVFDHLRVSRRRQGVKGAASTCRLRTAAGEALPWISRRSENLHIQTFSESLSSTHGYIWTK